MIILIEYKARLTYGSYEKQLCNIKHELDSETLQTTKFDFEPVEELDKSNALSY